MARVVLINSVLLAINTYWSQITVLPKMILREVESICRAFLWGQKAYGGHGLVAWEKICKKKAEGGLGIQSLLKWNQVAIGKYV